MFTVMCRPLLSMKMSVSQLASLTSVPSEDTSLQTRELVSVWSWSHYIHTGGHSLHARSVCCALVYPGWLLPHHPLCVFGCRNNLRYIQCGTDTSVPTASHFHKQMSDNLLTPSSPLPPCTHTASPPPYASWLTSCSRCKISTVCAFHLTYLYLVT